MKKDNTLAGGKSDPYITISIGEKRISFVDRVGGQILDFSVGRVGGQILDFSVGRVGVQILDLLVHRVGG